MLSDRVKNIIVGLTILVSLCLLMLGIFVLGKLPTWGPSRAYTVTLLTPNANGLGTGNKVNFEGVSVGNVQAVTLSPDMTTVQVICSIDGTINLPTNTEAYLGQQTIGTAYVTLTLPGDPAHPGSHLPAAKTTLPKDGTAQLAALPADAGLIPKGVIDRISKVGEDLDELLGKRSLTEFEKQDPDTRTANISILVQRLDRLAKGFDTLIGDPKTQTQFREIVTNVDDATKDLKTIMAGLNGSVDRVNGTIDQFSTAAKSINSAATQASATVGETRTQIVKVSEKLVTTLNTIEKTVTAMSQGNGTTGRLINDPRLYDGLVDLTRSLKSTTDDLNVLMRKWKDEGVGLNLK